MNAPRLSRETPAGLIGGKRKWCRKGTHAVGGVDGDNPGPWACKRCNNRARRHAKHRGRPSK